MEMFKERISYYDMDEHTAKMYRPIDEFLRLTKRYDPKALKRSYRTALLVLYLLIIPLAAAELFVLFFGMILLAFIFGGMLAGYVKLLHTLKKKQWKEVPTDILSCENIIDNDGIENVSHDFERAKPFGTKNVLIGSKYLFIKNATVIRLKDITKTAVRTVEGDDDSLALHYYQIYVVDEVGSRFYELGINGEPQKTYNYLNTLLKKHEETLQLETPYEVPALSDNIIEQQPILGEIRLPEKEYVYRKE